MNDRDIEDTRLPKEEREAIFCSECGQEQEQKKIWGNWEIMSCKNPFCPAKFEGVAKEMAETLVYEIEIKKKLEKRVKFLSNKLGSVDPTWKI